MPKPSIFTLQKIARSAYIPAVGYTYVEPKEESKHEFASTSLTFGKKNAHSPDTDINQADKHTRFPASSLSKIVFTYLVLQLVKENQIDLDESLHDILPYERFKVDGEYPEKAKKLTARHVLSHTTGLPNLGEDLSSPLSFDPKSKLGEKYSYSGEAFFYLQQVIEKKMGKNLEALAQEYVFGPLEMKHSTFFPQPENDTNIVKVHTELGKPTSIYVGDPPINAAGSLLTTADDFSKFMAAWLKNMNDPIMQQAFEPTNVEGFKKCGLGWHIFKNKGEIIAYQYGENPNTRAFVAINVTIKKGAAFFTNSENGMSVANQLFNSDDFESIGNLQEVFKELRYIQSEEKGWKETIAGKIAEDRGKFAEAKNHFEEAAKFAPEDKTKQLRLEWFNAVHQPSQEKKVTPPLKMFEGKYKNSYNDEIDIFIKDNGLIYKQFGRETKLVRISETEFLPEKDQSFKISFSNNQMSKFEIQGDVKFTFKQPSTKSQENSQLTSSTVMISKKLDMKLISPPLQKQEIDIENKKDNDKIAFQPTKEKKAAQESSSKTEKKRNTSTDDFNITHDKRLGK